MNSPFRVPRLRSDSTFKAIGNQKRDQRAWAEAAEAYRKHLDQAPNDFAIWVQLGNCSKEARHLPASEEAYKAAIALNGRDADVHLQLGHLYKLQGRRLDALKAYETAAYIDPTNADAKHEISSVLGNASTHNHSTIFRPLMQPASSLRALLVQLRADPTGADIFRRYFVEFVPD